jgi:hypothetical protein
MGTTLTGTTPQDTYDSLIKVTDNGPISGTLKALSDGLGNDSTLSLSTTAASIAGTLAVAGNATFDTTTLVVDAANNRVGVGTITPQYKVQVDGSADTDIVVSTSSNTNSAIVSTFNSNASSGNFMQLRSYGAGTSGTLFGASVAKANTLWSNSDALMAIGTIGATPLIFGTSNAERMRITSAGVLELAQGQIKFPATQVASADVNTLDDYEEGTFTPTASSGITINAINNATYTKIGNTVTFQIWIKVDIGSADFVIAGLPFTGSGRTTGSMSNTSQKETIANLLINTEIYGYAATTVLDDDLLIGGVYRVA